MPESKIQQEIQSAQAVRGGVPGGRHRPAADQRPAAAAPLGHRRAARHHRPAVQRPEDPAWRAPGGGADPRDRHPDDRAGAGHHAPARPPRGQETDPPRALPEGPAPRALHHLGRGADPSRRARPADARDAPRLFRLAVRKRRPGSSSSSSTTCARGLRQICRSSIPQRKRRSTNEEDCPQSPLPQPPRSVRRGRRRSGRRPVRGHGTRVAPPPPRPRPPTPPTRRIPRSASPSAT